MQDGALLFIATVIFLMTITSAGITYEHRYKGCMLIKREHVACDKFGRNR